MLVSAVENKAEKSTSILCEWGAQISKEKTMDKQLRSLVSKYNTSGENAEVLAAVRRFVEAKHANLESKQKEAKVRGYLGSIGREAKKREKKLRQRQKEQYDKRRAQLPVQHEAEPEVTIQLNEQGETEAVMANGSTVNFGKTRRFRFGAGFTILGILIGLLLVAILAAPALLAATP